jgi:hypothetical protein
MGLVVLRLGTGIPLVYFGIESLVGAAWGEPLRLILDGLGGIAGIVLIVGLWTPISGGLVAAALGVILFSRLFSISAQFRQLDAGQIRLPGRSRD